MMRLIDKPSWSPVLWGAFYGARGMQSTSPGISQRTAFDDSV
jgi:hypothetical protein